MLKLLQLYIIWTVIYMPIIFYRNIYKYEGGILKGFLVEIRNIFFNGSYYQLWYLKATVWALIYIILFSWILDNKKIFLISGAFYIINIVINTYNYLLPVTVVDWGKKYLYNIYTYINCKHNGLMFGFFYIMLGLFLSEKMKSNAFSMKRTVALFIVSFILWCVESYNVYPHVGVSSSYIFLIFVIYYGVQIVLNIDCNLNKNICLHLRTLSILIFCDHTFVVSIVNVIGAQFGNEDGYLWGSSFWYFLVVLFGSILMAEMILWISKKKQFGWLKYLY